MKIASQALAEMNEQRLQKEAEDERWARIRREAGPDTWLLILIVFAVLGGLLVFAFYVSGHAGMVRRASWLVWALAPLSFLFIFASWMARRREAALVRLIREEAPGLYEKLRERKVIR